MAESKARKSIRDKIADVWDIATSPEPAKEAEAKEAAARDKKRGPRTLPQTRREAPENKPDALNELTNLRDDLEPTPIEFTEVINADDLREFQLAIEAMIWATIYDFTPRFEREVSVSLRGDQVAPMTPPHFDIGHRGSPAICAAIDSTRFPFAQYCLTMPAALRLLPNP